MKATGMKVENFLSSKVKFLIPVYQRDYDWKKKQCEQLWDDILEVAALSKSAKESKLHFIGSIVYIHDAVYSASKIDELTIIDGQQRLTTLTLLYLALMHLAKELKDKDLVGEITETYLINKFAPEEEKLKLRPSENNDRALSIFLERMLPKNFWISPNLLRTLITLKAK